MNKELPESFLADLRELNPTSPLIIFDFETNGLSPTKNQPIQGAAMKITPNLDLVTEMHPEGGESPVREGLTYEIEFFDRFFRCPNIPSFITELTGITQQRLDAEGVDLHKGMQEMMEFMNVDRKYDKWNAWFIGHNAIKFDKKFLEVFMEKKNYIYPDGMKWWDTAGHYKAIKMNRIKAPDENYEHFHMNALNARVSGLKFKLTGCCEELGILLEGAHSADQDVIMTAWLFVKQGLAMKKVKAIS